MAPLPLYVFSLCPSLILFTFLDTTYQTIRHPNIISLFDVIETERYIGIVIEYASGTTSPLLFSYHCLLSLFSLSHLLPSLETHTFLICYFFFCETIGGELFDHILAHRYLKERDACRLFAQLMSGVHYLHSKHIVHRDLKLVRTAMQTNQQSAYVLFNYLFAFGG